MLEILEDSEAPSKLNEMYLYPSTSKPMSESQESHESIIQINEDADNSMPVYDLDLPEEPLRLPH